MSLEEECESPQLADRQIMNAFREVKEFCDGAMDVGWSINMARIWLRP